MDRQQRIHDLAESYRHKVAAVMWEAAAEFEAANAPDTADSYRRHAERWTNPNERREHRGEVVRLVQGSE